MATWDFACSEPIDANISVASGTVTLTAEATDAITVQVHRGRQSGPARDNADDDHVVNDVTVEFADRHLAVSEVPRRGLGWRVKDLHITISMPTGSRSTVQAASADVMCGGEYGAVDIRTASGKVDVFSVRGPAEISSMSGMVQINEAIEPTVQPASGRILVRTAIDDAIAWTR